MINTHIYFHGRPSGQSILNFNEVVADRIYLGQFLDAQWGSRVSSTMLVDVRGGKVFYTYLRKKLISEFSGRSGAYFAITLQFDNLCCSNVNGLFLLLSQIYEKLILGNILKRGDNGIEQFIIASFDERKTEFSKIANILTQNIDKLLSPYFVELNIKNTGYSSDIVEWSLDDVDSAIFGKGITKSRILIFPEFPSKDDVLKDVNKALNPLRCQCDSLQESLRTKEALVERLNGQIDSLNRDISSKENKINELDDRVSKIKKETEASFAAEKKQMSSDLTTANEKLRTSENAKNCLEREKRELSSQVSQHQRTISAKDTEISNLKSQLASLSDENKQLRKGLVNSTDNANRKVQTEDNVTTKKKNDSVGGNQEMHTLGIFFEIFLFQAIMVGYKLFRLLRKYPFGCSFYVLLFLFLWVLTMCIRLKIF